MPSIVPGAPVEPGSPYASQSDLDAYLTEVDAASTYSRQLSQPATPLRGPLPTVKHHYSASIVETVTSGLNTVYNLDTTNLAVSCIVPPSGMIDVTLVARYRNLTTGLTDWWLRDGSNNIYKDAAGNNCSAQAGPNFTGTVPAHGRVTMRVAQTSAGVPLTPGSRITLRWGHSSGGDNSYFVYGGGYGAARMIIEPVSNRLTERTFSQTASNTGYRPFWMSNDRSTLIGVQNSTNKIAWSTDDGTSWSVNPETGMSTMGINTLDNGELVVFCGQGDAGQVWVSSGWATNKATATFTKTLDFVGSPAESSYGAHPSNWSSSSFGPKVVTAEYGPKLGTADMARYVYRSNDYAQTWETIFDLAEMRPTGGSVNAHLHGVAYDPWWDAIWVIGGDDSQRGQWVSFDDGATWNEFLQGTSLQFTTVAPMRDCILLASDIAADGIYRIPRRSRKDLQVEYAFSVAGSGINIVGTGWYQNQWMQDAPMLIAANAAGGGSDPGRAFATYDGYEFVEFYTDTLTYADRGAKIFVGPTLANKFHGFVERGGAGISDWHHAIVTMT
jgi:hypothetical protein